MQTYFKVMRSMPARAVRVVGGLWLVMYSADLTPGVAFTLAVVGTAIAVTGIADICPVQLVFDRMSRKRVEAQRHAA